jgi:hypothetical protein
MNHTTQMKEVRNFSPSTGVFRIAGELALRQAQGERIGFLVRPELVEGRLSPT